MRHRFTQLQGDMLDLTALADETNTFHFEWQKTFKDLHVRMISQHDHKRLDIAEAGYHIHRKEKSPPDTTTHNYNRKINFDTKSSSAPTPAPTKAPLNECASTSAPTKAPLNECASRKHVQRNDVKSVRPITSLSSESSDRKTPNHISNVPVKRANHNQNFCARTARREKRDAAQMLKQIVASIPDLPAATTIGDKNMQQRKPSQAEKQWVVDRIQLIQNAKDNGKQQRQRLQDTYNDCWNQLIAQKNPPLLKKKGATEAMGTLCQ